MGPSLAAKERTDGWLAHAELLSEFHLTFPGNVKNTDLAHVFASEDGLVVPLSTGQQLGVKPRAVPVSSRQQLRVESSPAFVSTRSRFGVGTPTVAVPCREEAKTRGMSLILFVRDVFQVSRPIISLFPVDVVDLESTASRTTVECCCDKSMDEEGALNTIHCQCNPNVSGAGVNDSGKDAPIKCVVPGKRAHHTTVGRHGINALVSDYREPRLNVGKVSDIMIGSHREPPRKVPWSGPVETFAASRRAASILLAWLVLATVGCTGVKPQTVCYIGTSAVVRTVDTAYSVAGDLYRAGKLTEEAKVKLVAAHAVYQPAAQAVVAGCKAVDTQGDAEKQIALINAAADKVIEALVRSGVLR